MQLFLEAASNLAKKKIYIKLYIEAREYLMGEDKDRQQEFENTNSQQEKEDKRE